MRATHTAVLLSALLAMPCVAAGPVSVAISQGSIRINGVELRNGSQGTDGKYISLAAGEKVFGHPHERIEAWCS